MKTEISVLTFNVLGAPFITTHQVKNYFLMSRFLFKRIKHIGTILNTSQADIIALQEVYAYSLVRILENQMKHYPYVYYKKGLAGPKGGLILFSRYPVEEFQFISFIKQGTFTNKSIVGKLTKKGMLLAKLKDMPLHIINSNLTADTTHNWTAASKFHSIKQLQIEQLISIIQTMTAVGDQVIIAGDFNLTPNSELYMSFLKRSKTYDPFASSKIPTQHKDFLPHTVTPPRLDYIFYTSPAQQQNKLYTQELFTEKVKLTHKRTLYLSDHIALFASIPLSFKRQPYLAEQPQGNSTHLHAIQ